MRYIFKNKMSGTNTLRKPYPKEKNPFHEDAKSKSKLKRSFSNLKDSLRRSFRKKPEPQPSYASDSIRLKPIAREEEFVIRSRIPDRCTMQTRNTIAVIFPTNLTSTPVPPPRTSSIRKRNRLNSTSSSCTTNPFEDDVTPLFRDATTASRHTLNIPPRGMYGSQSTLRNSCESICTVGGTRRKKRAAPQPPNACYSTQSLDTLNRETDIEDSPIDNSVVEELQRLQCDITLMTADLIHDTELLNSNKDIKTNANERDVELINCNLVSEEDAAIIESKGVDDGEICDITNKADIANLEEETQLSNCKAVKLETNIPILAESNQITCASDNSVDVVEYVSSETIVLKRNISRRDSNANEIPTSPVELTSFHPIQRPQGGELKIERNVSFVQRRKARFEAQFAGEELSDEDELSDRILAKEEDTLDNANEVDVDINSNELPYTAAAVTREKLRAEEVHMRYIDDDRDDILELDNSFVIDRHLDK